MSTRNPDLWFIRTLLRRYAAGSPTGSLSRRRPIPITRWSAPPFLQASTCCAKNPCPMRSVKSSIWCIGAKEKDLILMVGMNFRYLSTSQRIRQVVQERQLGELGYAQFTYVRHRDGNRDDLNDYPLTMSYPMLLEQSIHHFDLLRYCYDSEVESLVADSWRPSWSTYENDCCVSVLFRFDNGARANYLGTWTASWNKMNFSWRTEFTSGVLIQRSQFDDLARVDFEPGLGLSGARFKTGDDAEPCRAEKLPPCIPFEDDSRLLLEEFTRAVGGEAEPVTTGRDHLCSLCLVQACIESYETGSWVNLEALYKKLGVEVGQ